MEALDVRELRYFVAVAEQLHFGRAATQLRIAQPALSKTVQRMEARLGVNLLVRSSRSVALTPAGDALLAHGRHALSAMDAAVRHTREAAEPDHLSLVLKPGGDAGLLSGLLTAYAEQPDAKRVEIVFAAGADRGRPIREGQADVGLLYAPFDDLTGLTATRIHSEDRVAVLPDGHPLADRASIHLDDLAGETFPRWAGIPSNGATGPELAEVAELIPLVRIGRVVAVLPRSLVSPPPPGIVCVPVADAGPSHIVIARRADDQRESVTRFIAAASTARG